MNGRGRIIDFGGKKKFVIILDYIFHSLFSLLLFISLILHHRTHFFIYFYSFLLAIAINNQFHKSDSVFAFLLFEKMVKILMEVRVVYTNTKYAKCWRGFFLLLWDGRKKSMQRLGKKERNRSFLRYISHRVITFKCYFSDAV